MFCSACGSLVDQNANFCKVCGICGKGRFLNLKYSYLLLPNSDRHCYKYVGKQTENRQSKRACENLISLQVKDEVYFSVLLVHELVLLVVYKFISSFVEAESNQNRIHFDVGETTSMYANRLVGETAGFRFGKFLNFVQISGEAKVTRFFY